MFPQTSFAAVAFGLIASVNGHAIMNTPTPYHFDTVSTSPLDGSSLQFPCQLGTSGSYQAYDGDTTAVTAGSTTLVNFTGSAIHGGGSCQFSVTYDDPPSADPSKWKVIHSIIGGCPAQAVGNVATVGTADFQRPDGPHCGDSTGTECVRQFNIPIPQQLKNGKATFAWTWFNNIGNAEMYMNCAPITISGGSSDESYTNSLPDLFVANVPGHCSTNADADGVLGFPDPGASVERNDPPTANIQGNCPAPDSGSSSGGSSSAGGYSTPAGTPTPTPSYGGGYTPAPVASTPQASYGASTPPAVFAPGASSAPAASSPAVASSPAASAPVASYAPAGTGAAGAGSDPNCTFKCSSPGSVVCIGSSQWGLCTPQMCATPMGLAAGTSCQNGVVAKRSEHLRRHHARHFMHSYF